MQGRHIQVEYNPQFKLFLHTKMSNPHYKPELQVKLIYLTNTPANTASFKAQTTLINFTVTRTGLEDQLLAEVVQKCILLSLYPCILEVVKADRPDLEEQKAALTRQQNEYKILLKVSLDMMQNERF